MNTTFRIKSAISDAEMFGEISRAALGQTTLLFEGTSVRFRIKRDTGSVSREIILTGSLYGLVVYRRLKIAAVLRRMKTVGLRNAGFMAKHNIDPVEYLSGWLYFVIKSSLNDKCKRAGYGPLKRVRR